MKAIVRVCDIIDEERDDIAGDFILTYYAGAKISLGNYPTYDPAAFSRDDRYYSQPIYTYVHGRVAMSTRPWNGRVAQGHAEFDSGLSGFISISKEEIRKWYGVKRISRKCLAEIDEQMQWTLNAFAAILNGEVFEVSIFEDGNDLEPVDGVIAYGYQEVESFLAEFSVEEVRYEN